MCAAQTCAGCIRKEHSRNCCLLVWLNLRVRSAPDGAADKWRSEPQFHSLLAGQGTTLSLQALVCTVGIIHVSPSKKYLRSCLLKKRIQPESWPLEAMLPLL